MPRRTKTLTCGAFEWQVSVSVLLGFTLSQSCIVFWPAPFLKCLQRSIWMLRKPAGRGTGRARNLLFRIWFLWIDEVGQACRLVSSCHLGFSFSSGRPGRISFSSSWPEGISSYSSWPGGICISCWQGRICIVLWLFSGLFCVTLKTCTDAKYSPSTLILDRFQKELHGLSLEQQSVHVRQFVCSFA